MRYLSIKNFDRFQQYKDRRPPWIKLHVSVLDDYEFITLSDIAKAHLMLLWALASQTDNKIPYDLAWITQRIGARSPVDIEELILRGFLEPYDEDRARGKREDWASRYVSAQTRTALLSAAQNRCAACGSADKLEIDHIVPISQGGTGDPNNLQVLCRQCNRRKRAKIAQGETPMAAHLRSAVLRSTKNVRSPETEAEGEGETEKKKRSAARSADAEPVPGSWVQEGVAWWVPNVGKITHARFGGALKEHVERDGWGTIFLALQKYVAAQHKAGKPAKVEWFAEDTARWLPKAVERDEHGDPTAATLDRWAAL